MGPAVALDEEVIMDDGNASRVDLVTVVLRSITEYLWMNRTTGWGKIPSILSVGHCEGRGGRRRVGLGSKGAGSWEVPVTTLRSRKDGVVQRAARICRRNLN